MNSCGVSMGTRRLFVTLRYHHGVERFLSVSPSEEAQEAFFSYLVALAPVCLVLTDSVGMRSDQMVAGVASVTDVYLAPEALLEGILTVTYGKASPRRRAQVLARFPSSPLRPYLQRIPSKPKADTRQISFL